MSTLRVDTITDEAGTGPVEFTNGINVSGGTVTGVEPFKYASVSGATQALDVGSHNFFDGGTHTEDTTVTFSNVPTEAKFTYSYIPDFVPFSLSSASTVAAVSVDVNSTGIFFKPDGTKMYTVFQSNNQVKQYTLSTPWRVSSATYDGVATGMQKNQAYGLYFKPDGTKMYLVHHSQGDYNKVTTQYSLSTPWDLSTSTYETQSPAMDPMIDIPRNLTFSLDGTKMYVTDFYNRVYQFTLSTAWATNTSSYSGLSFLATASQTSAVRGVHFNSSGTKMYLLGQDVGKLFQYSLSTAWNISTASYDSVSMAFGGNDFYIKEDGSSVYRIQSYAANEYSIGDFYTVTFPSSVSSVPSDINLPSRRFYNFVTLDGGTTVNLLNTDIL